ncbi:MAG TPA: hypothetical protein VGE26_12105 [Sphingobacteriaceae bacterium]
MENICKTVSVQNGTKDPNRPVVKPLSPEIRLMMCQLLAMHSVFARGRVPAYMVRVFREAYHPENEPV